MIRQAVEMKVRFDRAGSGAFGAPRGDRTHRGIDFVCEPQAGILSPVHGTITKLGYPYGDDLDWRYVEITDKNGLAHRLFYVEPCLKKGRRVHKGQIVGSAQDITIRYPRRGMKPHVHYEVKTPAGRYMNPENVS